MVSKELPSRRLSLQKYCAWFLKEKKCFSLFNFSQFNRWNMKDKLYTCSCYFNNCSKEQLALSKSNCYIGHTYIFTYLWKTDALTDKVIRRGLFALGKNNRDFSHLDQRNGIKWHGQKISYRIKKTDKVFYRETSFLLW